MQLARGGQRVLSRRLDGFDKAVLTALGAMLGGAGLGIPVDGIIQGTNLTPKGVLIGLGSGAVASGIAVFTALRRT